MTTDTESAAQTRPFEPLDWGLLITAAGIWGASFLLMDIALDDFEPGLITLLRVAFGFVTVSALAKARRPIDRADRSKVIVLGFTWMALPFTMFPLAQQWIDSSVTGMLNSAMPVMTLVIGAVV
ncbi:MAG: EamA family transporter, partial [Acidimicrobiales bacterium]